MDVIKSESLSALPGIEHGFGVGACEIEDMVQPGMRVFDTNQVHGKRVVRLEDVEGDGVLDADAFITNRSGLVCYIRTADCVPILIADRENCATAAVHAGWKGTVLDIAGEAIREMGRAYGTRPVDCVAAIGPRICGRCFEVGDEVMDGFGSLGIDGGWRIDDRHVDSGVANASLLRRAGLREIDILSGCTACDARFVSFRRDHTDARQASFIVIP